MISQWTLSQSLRQAVTAACGLESFSGDLKTVLHRETAAAVADSDTATTKKPEVILSSN